MTPERQMIAEYLSTNGARRFKMGMRNDFHWMKDFLESQGHTVSMVRGLYVVAKGSAKKKTMNFQGFVKYTDQVLVQAGLQPFKSAVN